MVLIPTKDEAKGHVEVVTRQPKVTAAGQYLSVINSDNWLYSIEYKTGDKTNVDETWQNCSKVKVKMLVSRSLTQISFFG